MSDPNHKSQDLLGKLLKPTASSSSDYTTTTTQKHIKKSSALCLKDQKGIAYKLESSQAEKTKMMRTSVQCIANS
jgi:hypothetical protein